MSYPRSIVLIDDDDLTNHIHHSVISKLSSGLIIRVFEDARDALRYLQGLADAEEEFPDWIFLDINMPNMNGWEFLTEYQELPDSSNRLYMLTSSIDDYDKSKARSFSCVDGFISKPLKIDTLEGLVGEESYWT